MKRARHQRGFTLIELMIALLVSSLLVGMILAIFSRMSIAYRGQQQIAGVQQVLAAARATIEYDAKQAGFAMPQGFMYNDGVVHQAVVVTNSNTGPDKLAFFYADASTQAVAAVPTGWNNPMTVDSTAGFAIGDVIVVSSADLTTTGLGANDGNIAKYSACVMRISGLTANTLTFSTTTPWSGVTKCLSQPVPTTTTMVYKFVSHGYRIDTTTPARAALGPLQMTGTGGLLDPLDSWTDLAYGFTDMQTSLQAYDAGFDASDSLDPDTDGFRDWYSGDLQTSLTQTVPAQLTGTDSLIQISISLVARTDRDVEGIATAATPVLVDPLNTANNTIGDRPSVALPSATDPALQGSRIYRYTTFQVDFRNLGVGR